MSVQFGSIFDNQNSASNPPKVIVVKRELLRFTQNNLRVEPWPELLAAGFCSNLFSRVSGFRVGEQGGRGCCLRLKTRFQAVLHLP